MTDVPPPPRPADGPGDERPSSDTPTEAVGAAGSPETTRLNAGGVPAPGEQYPGPPPGEWPPAPAARGGRLRRIGSSLRGSRVALTVLAVIVAAGLVLGGFVLADGGHDSLGRDGRGAVGQRDGRNGNADNNNGNGNNNDDNGDERDGNGRGGRGGAGTDRGRNGANGNDASGTEQSVLGTITAVSQTSITLRTSGGSPVYPLTATTPVTRNGSAAGVADLKVGDAVVVHVVTASAGASPVVERISVG